MASINLVNQNAEIARSGEALQINVFAASALKEVLSSNLGPKGTMKMLVSGGGDIKITKDGTTLLGEMHIQHPTAALIARVATAQDEIIGDGTTSAVILIGEIMRQGVHPRQLSEGLDLARKVALEALPQIVIEKDFLDRDILRCVAKSSLTTKIDKDVAELLTDIVVDAVLSIIPNDDKEDDIDLYMVEIMEMVHQLDIDTKLIKGLVLDHGGRHPDMPKSLKDCYVLICNVSFEYDKSEINSGFFYKSAGDRLKMVESERSFTNAKVQKVCSKENGKNFVVINQKGIDPISLEMFANEGILALRRAKRRNMERLMKCCGGVAMNSVDELTPECLGTAGSVYQTKLNDDAYTFIEEVPKSQSVTVLIKGPAKHTINQIKDAVRDGLRAVKNVINVQKKSICNLLPGCGAVEVFLHNKLVEFKQNNNMMKEQFGFQAFADALLVIPKIISKNGGHDPQEVIAKIQNEFKKNKMPIGVNADTGEAIDPKVLGVYDNLLCKRNMIENCTSISSNLMLVDELMRAGLNSLKPSGGALQ